MHRPGLQCSIRSPSDVLRTGILIVTVGCIDARRYVAIDGQPKYLTLYEFEHAAVSESAEWARARDSNPWSDRVRAFMRHDVGSPGVYRRLYPK